MDGKENDNEEYLSKTEACNEKNEDMGKMSEQEIEELREDYAVHERMCSQRMFAYICRVSPARVNVLVKEGSVEFDPKERMILLDRLGTYATMRYYAEKNAAIIKKKPQPFDFLLPKLT